MWVPTQTAHLHRLGNFPSLSQTPTLLPDFTIRAVVFQEIMVVLMLVLIVMMMVMLVVQMVVTTTGMTSKKLSLFLGLCQLVFTTALWGKIYTFSVGEVQRWSAEMLCVHCIYGHTVVRDPKFEPWKPDTRIAIKPYWEFGFIYPDQAQQGVGMSVPKCEICTQLTAVGWI